MSSLDQINASLQAAAHTVVGEKRDSHGQWTSGGNRQEYDAARKVDATIGEKTRRGPYGVGRHTTSRPDGAGPKTGKLVKPKPPAPVRHPSANNADRPHDVKLPSDWKTTTSTSMTSGDRAGHSKVLSTGATLGLGHDSGGRVIAFLRPKGKTTSAADVTAANKALDSVKKHFVGTHIERTTVANNNGHPTDIDKSFIGKGGSLAGDRAYVPGAYNVRSERWR